MSAAENESVKLDTYGEESVEVKCPSNKEHLNILLRAESPTEDESREDKGGQIELRTSNQNDTSDCKDSTKSIDINNAQTLPVNETETNADPDSPSQNIDDRFKRMHLQLPKINYTEKIVFCLDMSSDMARTQFKMGDGSQFSPLSMIKRTIELFVENKHFINRKHEFSLMVLYDSATWVRDFTNDPKELIESLQDLNETQDCSSCDLASVVTLITDKYEMRVPRRVSFLPCIYRVILIYGRSNCMINFSSEEAREFIIHYPFFVVDVIYIHEPPTSENKCQDIFEALCDLDEHDKSYIFEVTSNATKLHNSMAKLLAHPTQRCAQKDATYSTRAPFSQEVE